MNKFFAAAALLALIGGCSADRGGSESKGRNDVAVSDEKPSSDTFAVGSDLLPTGAVQADSAGQSFTRGGEVFLSVNVASASTSQAINVEWIDAAGHVVRRERREVPRGARYAAFSSGNTAGWGRGACRVVVGINGRQVSQREFAMM